MAMRMIQKRLAKLAAVAILALALPAIARAQFLGYVGNQTVTQNVFTNASCSSTLTSSSLSNIGQVGHQVSYAAVSGGPNLQVQIQGSANGVNYFKISNDAPAQPGIIVGVGAYAFIRVQVLNGGAGCTITANYTGSSLATTVNVATSNAQFMYQNNVLVNLAANANQSTTNISPPFGNSAGFIVFSYLGAAGPSGSTITVSATDSLTGTTFPVATQTLITTVNTAQVITVPNISASNLTVSYTSGGSSTATFSADYYFTYPGQSPSISPPSAAPSDPCESPGTAKVSAPVSFTVAGTPINLIQSVTGKTIYICGVSVSAVATAAGTYVFITGTNAGCTTGAATVIPNLQVGTSPGSFSVPFGMTALSLPSGINFCVNSSATGISIGGIVTYVQQ